jgi:hypothetical protein
MRDSLLHWIFGYVNQIELDFLYKLSPYSYFSESAYTGDKNWKKRYWGDNV